MALRAFAATLLLGVVYVGVLWYQVGVVLDRGAALQEKANASVLTLSTAIEDFRGDPDSAAALTPGLRTAREELEELKGDVGGVADGLLPPLPSLTKTYPESFLGYLDHLEEYFADLSSVSAFVVERAEAMTQVGEGLKVLEGLSAQGVTEVEVAGIISEARVAVDASVSRLRTLDARRTAGVIVYSSEALLSRLEGLSGALAEIEEGLAASDTERVRTATRDFSILMGADWRALFFAADQQGLEQFRDSLALLGADRETVLEARAEVVLVRSRLWAIAFGALLLAVFISAVAWLR